MLEQLVLNNFRGMNRVSDKANMSPDFAWNISNGYIKKDIKSGLGIIKQRSGIIKHNSVSFTNSCKYIYEAKWDAGGTDRIIREGTRWAKYDGVDSYDDLDTGRASGVRGMAVMFANQLIMVDGGVPRKSTAAYAVSALSSDASMPQDASAVHVHQHKVWLNSDSKPMRAYYSKTDSANASDSWSASGDAGYIDFTNILPHGDRLIGFKTFGEAFLCFIFKKMVVIYSCGTNPTEFALQQIIPLNCASGHALSIIGNDFSVCSQEGVNSFRSSTTNQDLDIDDMSKYIQPLYSELVSPLEDLGVISTAFSHRLNHLYVCIPGTDHTILVYSLDIKNFVGVWTGYDCHSILECQDGTMLVGGDGYVYEMNTGTNDDGVAISFSYDFPYLYFGNPNNNKNLKQIEGICRHDGSPLLTISYDFGVDEISATPDAIQLQFESSGVLWDSDNAVWDEASWAGGDIERFLSSDMTGRGKQVAISLRQSVLDASIEIPYVILRYKKEGIKIR